MDMFEVIVWLILARQNKIFLLEKQTPQYHQIGLIGGKLERAESIKQAVIREVMEEINVEISEDDLVLKYTVDRKLPETQKIHLIFQTSIYKGSPINAEPHKHISANWYDLNDLPSNLCPIARLAIESLTKGTNYGEIGW